MGPSPSANWLRAPVATGLLQTMVSVPTPSFETNRLAPCSTLARGGLTVKAKLLEQANAYFNLAEKRARELGLPPPQTPAGSD